MLIPLLTLLTIVIGLWPRKKSILLNNFNKAGHYEAPLNKESMVVNMRQANISTVRRYAWYAGTGFCSDKQLKAWDCKACLKIHQPKFIKSFDNPFVATRGYIAVDDSSKAILVIFRGSKNIINYIYNILTLPLIYEQIEDEEPLALVNVGFLKSMESLADQFLPILVNLLQKEKYKQYKLHFIGHSLGGAIASLALIKTQKYLQVPFERMELYTYGTPRLGNRKFARWYNQRNITVARSVNFNDPIPFIPARWFYGYSHHGLELFINATSKKVYYCNQQFEEDPNCGASFNIFNLSTKRHNKYFDVDMTMGGSC